MTEDVKLRVENNSPWRIKLIKYKSKSAPKDMSWVGILLYFDELISFCGRNPDEISEKANTFIQLRYKQLTEDAVVGTFVVEDIEFPPRKDSQNGS